MARVGVATDETDLLNFCGASLARFKVPHHVRFVSVIPRTSSNKAMRRLLLQNWLAEQPEPIEQPEHTEHTEHTERTTR